MNVSEFLTRLQKETPDEFDALVNRTRQSFTIDPVPVSEVDDQLNCLRKDATVFRSEPLAPIKIIGYKISREAVSHADKSPLLDSNALNQAILAIESELMLRPLIPLSQLPNCESLGAEKLQ